MWNERIVIAGEQDNTNVMRRCVGCKFREEDHRSTYVG